MRFSEFKYYLTESIKTSISADHLEGLKDVISRRIKALPDDESTAKALREIEELLQHVGAGGRLGSIKKDIGDVQDTAVSDAKKVLARLVLSIIEEVNATPPQRAEFFDLWKKDRIVSVEALLSKRSVGFKDVFAGYGSNPIITEFVNEVMSISDLGMGRGEFGLNVLSRSISVAKGGKSDDEAGGKKGDLQVKLGDKTLQVELKTESGGAARFGDQEVRPAEGFEAAAVALNTWVKKHKLYNQLDRKLSGSGMNLNQVIQFHQILPPGDQKKFLGLVRNCLSLIFGNIQGGRTAHLGRLKKNVNEIMSAIEVGNNGGAAQAYSQASFNFYMSRKHDDGVLYANLNNNTFVYYDDAAQLLAQGLRFHASTPYISATKDPVRAVYPQIGVTQTSFGAKTAKKTLPKYKAKDDQNELFAKFVDWSRIFANRRGVKDARTINKMAQYAFMSMQEKRSVPQVIADLEQMYPQLVAKIPQQSTQQYAQQQAPVQQAPVQQAPVQQAPVQPTLQPVRV